jgi:tetratricopeptide (TPR) repeat protein
MKTLFEKPGFWAKRFERISYWIFLGTISAIPLVYFPFTFEHFELPKQSILLVGVLLSWLFVLAARALRPVKIQRSHYASKVLLLLLGIVAISSLYSSAPYLSWVGQSGLESQSFLSFLLYTLVFSYGVQYWKTKEIRREVIMGIAIGTFFVGLIGLVGLFFMDGGTLFTSIGTVNAFTIFLSVMSLLVLGVDVSNETVLWRRWVFRVLVWTLPLMSVFFLIVLDYSALWFVYLIGLASLLFMQAWTKTIFKKSYLGAFLGIVGVLFLFILPSPFVLEVPTEVTPSIATSWAVLSDTLTSQSFFFGSGPGTFAYDYQTYRPLAVNKGLFWEMRFSQGYSFFFDYATTTGVLGFISLLLFLFFIKAKTGIAFLAKREGDQMKESAIMLPAWGALVSALCLFPANITLLLSIFVLSSLFAGVWVKESKIKKMKSGIRLQLFLFAVLCLGLIFFTSQRLMADTIYAEGLLLDQKGAAFDEVLSKLDRAAYYNRLNDSYYRTLAESFVYQATSQIEGVDAEVSEAELAYIQAFLNAGINAAERAVGLAPRQGYNWLVLGRLYQYFYPYSINGIESSQIAFDRLLIVEPANPLMWVAYGEMYLDAAIYDELNKEKWLSLAEDKFAHALSLKPDYGETAYKLANVYLAQGRNDAAIDMMVALHATYPSDATVAFELGVLYLERGGEGDLDLAGIAFAEAITLVPSYVNAYWYLSSVYEQRGEIEQAIIEVERVLELQPNNSEVLARLAGLKEGLVSGELSEL